MKSLKIFFITLVLTSQNEASESSCNSLMKYNEKIFTFQSPNYPSSIGNGSLMCNLRIEHAPSIEDVQMQLQQECQDGGGGGGDSGGNGGGHHPNQHLHERAASTTSTPRKEVPPSVQLLLEEVWAIEANMAAPPIMVRG